MSQRITIVNDRDEIIGSKERDRVEKDDIYRVTALWLTNSQGDILLAQRKLTKRHNPGKWGPAVAGTVEEGETYESNIIKEAREELGLSNIKLTKGPKQFDPGEYVYFCQWFVAVVDKPVADFIIQEDEVEQVKWFSRLELKQALHRHPEQFVPALNAGIRLLEPFYP